MENDFPKKPTGKPSSVTIPRVLVATTAMLTFISFWQASAIVLNDLASSAFYAGGIAEELQTFCQCFRIYGYRTRIDS